MIDRLAEVRAELGSEPDPDLGQLDDQALADLVGLLRAERVQRAGALSASLDHALRGSPRQLRERLERNFGE